MQVRYGERRHHQDNAAGDRHRFPATDLHDRQPIARSAVPAVTIP
jgi:hypothetical protein